MSHADNNSLDALPLGVFTRVHQICEEFEQASRSGVTVSLDAYLARMEPEGLLAGFRELLSLELEYRRAKGERPESVEYIDRFPDYAETIQLVWQDTPVSLSSATPPPAQFGDFRLLREIGRGGMGVVYLAEQDSLDRHVAIKVLSQATVLDPARRERFQREARSAAALQHAHIVPVYGVGQHGDFHYYVMRFVEGRSLDKMIKQLAAERDAALHLPLQATRPDVQSQAGSDVSSGRGTTSRAHFMNVARIIRQAAEGLQHAHGKGFLHRDIKPSNLLLDDDGKLWITDFGLAKSVTDSQQLTQTGDFAGTLKYMAPETINGDGADFRSDIYGLGLTMYELLTLKSPYPESDHGRLIDQVLHGGEATSPRKINPMVPRDLETICLKCIQKEASKRYASANDLAEDLLRYLHGEPIRARRVPVWTKSLLWAKRQPLIAGLTLFAMLMTVGMFAGLTVAFAAAARRAESETARANAQEARSASERARAESERLARLNETRLRQNADTRLVYSRVALAERSWLAGEIAAARRYLAQCAPPPGAIDHRGWEWNYVNALCHNESLVLPHTFWVNSVAFHPDGQRLATGAGSPGKGVGNQLTHSELHVWNARTGERITTLIEPEQAAPAITSVEFSNDGKWLVAHDAAGNWQVWNTQSWQSTLTVNARAAGCVPRSTIFAVLGDKCELIHFDLVTGDGPTEMRGPIEGFPNRYNGAFAADKRRVAIRSFDFPVTYVVDSLTGAELSVVESAVTPGQVLVDPTGQRLVDSESLWNVASGEDLGRMSQVGISIFIPAFSDDGKWLAWTTYPRRELLVRSTATDVSTQRLDKHLGAINALSFSADSQILATASADNTVRVWQLAGTKLEEVRVLKGHLEGVRGVAISADGSQVASASQDQTVRLWNWRGDPRGVHLAFKTSDGEAVNEFAFNADSSELVVSRYQGLVRLDTTTGAEKHFQAHDVMQTARFPRSHIRVIADGCMLMGIAKENPQLARVWSLESTATEPLPADGETPDQDGLVLTLEGHTKPIRCLAADGTGQRFASLAEDQTTRDGVLMIWDRAGKQLHRIEAPGATCLAMSRNGAFIAAGGIDSAVRVWDCQTGLERFTTIPQEALVSCLTFSENATLIAATTRDRVSVWNTANGALKYSIRASSKRLSGVAFSPDGQRLATIGFDEGVVQLRDAATGEDVMTLRGFAGARPNAYGYVAKVAFSRDGRRIVANNWDGSFNIWSTPEPKATTKPASSS